MKQIVIKFLQNPPVNEKERFNEAFELLRKLPNIAPTLLRYYNSSGYTKSVLQELLYDLQQGAGIKKAELLKKKAKLEIVKIDVNDLEVVLGKEIPLFNGFLIGLAERKKFADDNGIIVQGSQSKDYDEAFELWSKQPFDKKEDSSLDQFKEELKSVFKQAEDPVKEYVSLFDQFPFLKDDDCPNELKILVNDKRIAYENVKTARKELIGKLFPEKGQEAASNDEIFTIAKEVIGNFTINQDIFKELNYYAEHKEVLGKHPLLEDLKLHQDVSDMSIGEATVRKTNLNNYIRRDTKSLNSAKTEKTKKKYKKKVSDWEKEMILVNDKLGIINAPE